MTGRAPVVPSTGNDNCLGSGIYLFIFFGGGAEFFCCFTIAAI